MEEKRELVYEISKWSHGAPEMLQSWSRRELLQILCAEMGKERKYTGLTKYKMIEHLLRIVSERKSGKQTESEDSASHPPTTNTQTSSKRQRKAENPSRVAIPTNHFTSENAEEGLDNVVYCQNLACRAAIRLEDQFCKRCSCCICFKYDDNKDPSLWLVCNSEPPNHGDSCGMSCHLECAIKHGRAGISEDGHYTRLDGKFYCISCGKVNDLLGCWKKQLMIAKDARRVDILCYRLSISHKLLSGTTKYLKLHEFVDTAVKKLELEVGSVDGLPTKMARGIVNRLSSGAEIQKLCTLAMEALDSMNSAMSEPSPVSNIQEENLTSPSIISVVDVSSTSLTVVLGSDDSSSEETVGYTLWHREVGDPEYALNATCTMYRPNRRFFVSDLIPATEYMFKVVAFGIAKELGKWEVGFRTGPAVEDLENLVIASPKANSGPSNASSERDESNDAAFGDPSNSAVSYSGYCEKSDTPDRKVTEYACKEASHSQNSGPNGFGQTEITGMEETAGESVSALDEERAAGDAGSEPNSTIQAGSQRDSTNSTDNHASAIPQSEAKHLSENQLLDEPSIDNESNAPAANEMEVVPYGQSESVLPVTPCKVDIGKDGSVRSGRPKSGEPDGRPMKPEEPLSGSSSKKRSAGRCEELCDQDSLERDYEYCVKVIRWLECEGYVQKNFRVKFLTWFSLQATLQERRIVSVYVDTLIDDPPSLAGQLVDTFSEGIYRKRLPPVPSGFCMKLWH
ncbi:hypothetical protein ACLOJK_030675 [Asimina triloba]